MNGKRATPASGRKPVTQKTAPRKSRASATKRGKLKLDARLRIDGVMALKDSLNHLLANSTTLTIDASGVEKTDTSALQLLTAFSATAARRNIEIHWQKPSEPFLQAIRLLGLETPLNLASIPHEQRRGSR